MNFAIILADGNGSRIKNSIIPKSFIEIDSKPIVIHTFEKFMYNPNINQIIIVCHQDWMEYLNQTLNKFSYNLTNLHIVPVE